MQPNGTKCTKTSVWGPMGWTWYVRCEKFRRDFVARTFALVRPVLPRVFKTTKWSRMHPNSTKCTKTTAQGPMWCIGSDRCQKIPTRLRGTNVWTSLARLTQSFVRQPNGPESTQIVRNTPKCQLRVQWGGSGAFVAKNSNATSWHELLH